MSSDQARVVNRLKRARGQLDALIRAIEAGEKCEAVLTQLAAVSKAIDRAGYLIVAQALIECQREGESAHISRDRLEKLFLTLS